MKIAALIFGILAGLSTLPLAQYAHALVGMGGGKDGSLLYLLPIMSFIGGGIALNMPAAAAGLLGLSAVVLLAIGAQFGYAVNIITIGPVLLNSMGALFAFIGYQSTPETDPSVNESPHRPSATHAGPSSGAATSSHAWSPIGKSERPQFDRLKWNALVKYDDDIGRVAEQLKLLGDKWVDIFAADYLALGDKAYLPAIIRKILEQAKEEREEQAKTKIEIEPQVEAKSKRAGWGSWE